MDKYLHIFVLLKRLWFHLTDRRRLQFGVLLLLMLLASLTEILSIGAILPFLAVLSDPAKVFYHPHSEYFIKWLGIDSPDKLLLPLTATFGFAATLAGCFRLLLSWTTTRLSFATGADLSYSIYRRTLYQPYSVHVMRNSSEVINGIVSKASAVIYSVIGPVISLISSVIILIAIAAILFYIEPTISIFAFLGFGGIYLGIVSITGARKIRNSKIIAYESTQVVKTLQEGLGGVRDILIDGSQSEYCQVYQAADEPLRRAQGSNQFIAQAPRYFVEALGMVLIAALAYVLAGRNEGITLALPVLGSLALGAQRMLPSMQLAYASWSNIQGGHASLRDTLDLLDQPLPEITEQEKVMPMLFIQAINLENVCFRYNPRASWILNNLNFSIAKGSRTGLIGTTGSGKSTLLDIVMGLLEPTQGVIKVDGKVISESNQRSWQAHIAHVPQAIFLTDGTIEENIAFGQSKNKINRLRVIQAAKQAQIADIIETWPDQYETFVGERGVRLSGGQRQRIGIARALYKKADFIIFDEATSALDNETEQAVMEAIEGLGDDLTVLIVAHRLTTLKNCTQIVELGDGGIRRIGSYQDIVTKMV
jgi:ABC-type multidrug transport system fused ATPase/permease subunit